MADKLSNPRGTADILPNETPAWRFLEKTACELFRVYGYREIRTPIFEEVSLFKRSLGETTEVVNKQLLEVRSQRADAEDASFALRPEGTAPVVRVYNQNGLERAEGLSKLFYIGPMFRGERPQKGRLRQFHQIGAEAIGYQGDNPLLDVEMIALASRLLTAFGVNGFKLKVNSLGTAEDKAGFAQWLRAELKGKIGHLSEECKNQYERNVFRLLDSKDKDCQEVIRSLNIGTAHLSERGLKYFEAVKKGLDQLGIAYEVSNQLVRGLDYYTHTVFEISYEGLGAQDALGAGGRYNCLIEQLGGGDKRMDQPVAAIGFAFGIERILLALKDQGKLSDVKPSIDAYLVSFDRGFEDNAFQLVNTLRQEGISADMDFGGRAAKQQFTQADKRGAKFVLILGEEEVKNGAVSVKDMVTGNQVTVPLNNVVKQLKLMIEKGSI